MSTPTPIEKWARETARSLVTVYLDTEDDITIGEMISTLLDDVSKERLEELLYVFVGAVGDVFVDLDDYSRNIINSLGKAQG